MRNAVDRHTERPDGSWYLLQCKPRQDSRALEHLRRQGFDCFAPTFRAQSLRAGRLREVEQPLFPGYLFIRMGEVDNWLPLRSTRGVNRVVAFCGQPCRVQERIVEQLKTRCATTEQPPLLNPGDQVQVRIGAYADLDAIFLSMDGEERVMLLLNILNREQQVQVSLANVQPVLRKQAAVSPF
ncbi:transcription/translation regulatory transformer protein RfaH [Stutzerimonas stutzeri]